MVKAVASQYAKLFVVYKPHAPTNRRTTVTRLDLSTAARAKVPDILSRDPDTHTHTHARTHAHAQMKHLKFPILDVHTARVYGRINLWSKKMFPKGNIQHVTLPVL